MNKINANSNFTPDGQHSRGISIPERYTALENESQNDSSFKNRTKNRVVADQSVGRLFGHTMQDEISKAIHPDDINELENFATDNKIQKQVATIVKKKNKQNYDKYRIWGVGTAFITNEVIEDSFKTSDGCGNQNSSDEGEDQPQEGETDIDRIDFTKYLIIDGEGAFIAKWRIFVAILSTFSSYYYSSLASFGDDENHTGFTMTLAFELTFCVAFAIRFLTSYVPDGQIHAVTDHALIAKKYLSDSFPQDLIALLPFTFMFKDKMHHDTYHRLFYLLKC